MTTIPLPLEADVHQLHPDGRRVRLRAHWTHHDTHEEARARAARPVDARGTVPPEEWRERMRRSPLDFALWLDRQFIHHAADAPAPGPAQGASLFIDEPDLPPPRG